MMQQAVVGKITLTATQELHADVYQAGGTDSTIDVAYLSVLEGMVMASSRKDFGG